MCYDDYVSLFPHVHFAYEIQHARAATLQISSVTLWLSRRTPPLRRPFWYALPIQLTKKFQLLQTRASSQPRLRSSNNLWNKLWKVLTNQRFNDHWRRAWKLLSHVTRSLQCPREWRNKHYLWRKRTAQSPIVRFR